MEVDEPMNSRPSSRSNVRRSPMPPPPVPSSSSRPFTFGGTSTNSSFATLPRPGTGFSGFRDYSCPPSSRNAFGSKRSSSGIFITSMFGPKLRHLQNLHSEAFGLGLNAVCYPGLPAGTMFRSSLPATPVCTPIHAHPFTLTEAALRERLCGTPSPRKGFHRGFTPLNLNSGDSPVAASSRTTSRSSDQPMDITCPSTPIEPVPESPGGEDSSGSGTTSGGDSQRGSLCGRPPTGNSSRKGLFGGHRVGPFDQT